MNSKLKGFMIFIMGATVGSIASWQYAWKKYAQIAQEEIDSVKEAYRNERMVTPIVSEPDEDARIRAEQAKDKPSVTEYAAKLLKQGYTNYSSMSSEQKEVENIKNEEDEEPMVNDNPYVIPPEDFGELNDYEKISLTYYDDGVLADDNNEPVDDVENLVGLEALESFGEYEDDSVFVRNDRLKCDYEILLDQRRHSDVVNRRPHEVDD